MDIRDLRIGDLVQTKSSLKDNTCKVLELESPNTVRLKIDSYNLCEFDILDICGVKATNETLTAIGGIYDSKKVEYILTLSGGLRVVIRPKVGTENYTATILGQYRSPYCHFTYIHTLQHWLWDMYRIEL